MDTLWPQVLLKCMFLLKEKSVWQAYTALHQREARVATIKRMFNLPHTQKSQKLDPGFTPLFLQHNDCKISLFLSVPQVPQL